MNFHNGFAFHTLLVKVCVGLASACMTSACVDVAGPPTTSMDSLEVVWQTRYFGHSWSGAPDVATDGERFFAVLDGGVAAYDLRTGTRWWITASVRSASFTLVAGEDRIFVAEGVARALDTSTGEELWRFAADSAASGRSAADERAFYFGTRGGKLYALSATSGDLLWAVETVPESAFGATLLRTLPVGDTLYVSVGEDLSPTGHLKRGFVIALNRVTGAEHWRSVNQEAGRWHTSDAVALAGDMLLVGDLNGNSFFGLNRFTGEEIWRFTGAPDRFGPDEGIEAHDGIGYIASWDAFVYAVDPQTGEILWKTDVGSSADAAAVCNDHVYVSAGLLYKLSRADGKIEAVKFADWQGGVGNEWVQSSLLAHGGRLYFVTNLAVYAIECE